MAGRQFSLLSPRSQRRRRRWLHTLRRRHGGFVKPPASGRMRDGGRRTPATVTTAPTSSSPLRGARPVVQVLPPLRVQPSRLIAPTWSGNATAAVGASGAPLARAVWPDGVSRFYDPGPPVPPPSFPPSVAA